MNNQTDFSSRVSIRAVVTGVMVSLSFMILAFSLIAALGIWSYNVNELSSSRVAFWISATIAWVFSLYFAGVVSAFSARSQSSTEGALNAIASCCGSYLVLIVGFLYFAPSILEALLSTADQQFFLRLFLGNILAFSFGIYGGIVGVHLEQRSVDHFRGVKKTIRYST